MKKMLISEDEKSRILNLHQNLGYKTSLNEQSVPQQPQPNVQKPTESGTTYFLDDPIGKKIASISPSFVKWTTTNNIQPYAAKFNVLPNEYQLTAVGTDGQTYTISLNYFNVSKGTIPQDANEKMRAANNVVREKIKELNVKGAGTLKCFDFDNLSKNKNSDRAACKQYFIEFDAVVKSTDFNYYKEMNVISKFASVAPKFQPKQG
jgi:hypothetical protein